MRVTQCRSPWTPTFWYATILTLGLPSALAALSCGPLIQRYFFACDATACAPLFEAVDRPSGSCCGTYVRLGAVDESRLTTLNALLAREGHDGPGIYEVSTESSARTLSTGLDDYGRRTSLQVHLGVTQREIRSEWRRRAIGRRVVLFGMGVLKLIAVFSLAGLALFAWHRHASRRETPLPTALHIMYACTALFGLLLTSGYRCIPLVL